MSDFKWQFVFSMQDRGRFSMLGLGDIVSICHHHCLFVITAQVYNSILIKIVQTDILLLLHWILLPRSTKSRIFLKSWILCICSSTGPLLTVWQREGHYWTIAWREFIILYFSSWRIFFTFWNLNCSQLGYLLNPRSLSPCSWGQGDGDPGNEVVPLHVLTVMNYPVSFLVGHARTSPMFCSEIR